MKKLIPQSANIFRRSMALPLLGLMLCTGSMTSVGASELLEVQVAQKGPVLAEAGPAIVTQSDFDAFMARIPEEDHVAFLNSPARVEQALTQLLVARHYMAEAERTGFLENPLHQAVLFQLAARVTAERLTEKYVEENTLDDYSDRAHELYLADPGRFRRPASLDFTHLLISVGPDDDQVAAMKQVLAIHEELEAGKDLADLVAEYSDDPRAGDNQGRYENIDPEQLEGSIRRQLEKLDPGERSEPFPSSLGWHVVRLDAEHEAEVPGYEDVRQEALEQARNEHRVQLRERLRSRLTRDHQVAIPEGAVRELLERYNVDWNRDYRDLVAED